MFRKQNDNGLPAQGKGVFLTDGGLETALIFHEGIDLPEFAAFPLLASEAGRQKVREYYGRYLSVAAVHGTGFILDLPTWRASFGWGSRLGVCNADVLRLNQAAAGLAREIAAEAQTRGPVLINGVVGPAGDGYDPEKAELRAVFPNLVVLGGCCGTDHRHIGEIARASSGDGAVEQDAAA